MSKIEIYGYTATAFFLLVLIFASYISWSMYRTGFSYSRKIPLPPLTRKKTCVHVFSIADVVNLEIDPLCVRCEEKLSELKKNKTI